MSELSPAEPTAEQLTWRTEWSSRDAYNLRVETTRRGDRTLRRFRSGTPASGVDACGAVVVCVRDRTASEVLLVHQQRVNPGVALWELPRGMIEASDPDAVACALRELHEETGVHGRSAEFVGLIYPDSGLIGDGVAVVSTVAEPGSQPHPADRESDDVGWFAVGELPTMIADGSLRDGISLAGLALAHVRWQTDS